MKNRRLTRAKSKCRNPYTIARRAIALFRLLVTFTIRNLKGLRFWAAGAGQRIFTFAIFAFWHIGTRYRRTGGAMWKRKNMNRNL